MDIKIENTISCVIATFGDRRIWDPLAERALQSIYVQTCAADEIHRIHGTSLHEARNEGVALSRSEWILFADADDCIEPQYVFFMKKAILENKAGENGLYYPRVRYVMGNRSQLITHHKMPLSHGRNYLCIGTLVNRKQFLKLGGFHAWEAFEDYDYFLRAIKDGSDTLLVLGAIYRAHVNVNGRNRVKDPEGLIDRILADNGIKRRNGSI